MESLVQRQNTPFNTNFSYVFPISQNATFGIGINYDLTNTKITDKNIIGHSDITAKTLRKIDPGVAFDWRFLNILGHGIYHEIEVERDNNEVIYKLGDKGENIKILQTRLRKLGYELETNEIFDRYLANTIFAFKLHYLQHSIKQNSLIGYGKCYKYLNDLIIKLSK